jgi:hypothetical protein
MGGAPAAPATVASALLAVDGGKGDAGKAEADAGKTDAGAKK